MPEKTIAERAAELRDIAKRMLAPGTRYDANYPDVNVLHDVAELLERLDRDIIATVDRPYWEP
jgi:hypothetical protein